jgi:hypothetical protein
LSRENDGSFTICSLSSLDFITLANFFLGAAIDGSEAPIKPHPNPSFPRTYFHPLHSASHPKNTKTAVKIYSSFLICKIHPRTAHTVYTNHYSLAATVRKENFLFRFAAIHSFRCGLKVEMCADQRQQQAAHGGWLLG